MGSLLVHDSNEAPAIRMRSVNIRPGKYYDIFIEKQTTILLPLPYQTDCVITCTFNDVFQADVCIYLGELCEN